MDINAVKSYNIASKLWTLMQLKARTCSPVVSITLNDRLGSNFINFHLWFSQIFVFFFFFFIISLPLISSVHFISTSERPAIILAVHKQLKGETQRKGGGYNMVGVFHNKRGTGEGREGGKERERERERDRGRREREREREREGGGKRYIVLYQCTIIMLDPLATISRNR